MPKDAPTNEVLIDLPDFLKVAGTLDAPRAEIDCKALASAALIKYADKIPGVDDKTGQLIKGFRGLLSGQGNTNSSATNKATVSDLFNSLTRPRSKPAPPEPTK